MKIPNCENAVVAIEKLRDYALNEEHSKGKHKAIVFRSALGFTKDDAEELRTILLDIACNDDAIESDFDEYGQRYIINFFLRRGNDQEAIIHSAWMIRTHEDFPRLLTCYVK